MNWISIDFGTCSSVVGVLVNRRPELVAPAMADGSKLFPTVAFVNHEGQIYACHQGQQMSLLDLSRYVREFKLDMTRDTDPLLGVSHTDIVAEILRTLKHAAEGMVGEVQGVVLTIPAIYSETDTRKQVMLEAATKAGFLSVDLIKEAEAAAIYYDFVDGREAADNSMTLVYDLGGGTFDPVLVRHAPEGYSLVGDPHEGIGVGGKFFTECIVRDYLSRNHIVIEQERARRQKQVQAIKLKCENIKRYLSEQEEGCFPVEETGQEYRLSRKEFEGMISKQLDRTLESCDKLLNDTEVAWDCVSRVLLIGGSCHIPLVREKIQSFLHSRQAPATRIVWRKTEKGYPIDPQFAVALGGAVYALKRHLPPPARPQIGMVCYDECGELVNRFLKEGDNIIGRASSSCEADIPIAFREGEKKSMSRRHVNVSVRFDAGENAYHYFVFDLDSKNGTYVNNTRINALTELRSGDVIRAGRHEITIQFINH